MTTRTLSLEQRAIAGDGHVSSSRVEGGAGGDAVSRLYRVAGGEAVYRRSPIEKLFRDVNVATQHAMVSERLYETVGRIRLGIETDTRTL